MPAQHQRRRPALHGQRHGPGELRRVPAGSTRSQAYGVSSARAGLLQARR